jgi:hypothetical protein
MSWKPIVIFTYENHAALDESGNHNNGIVSLPAPDRWVDAPFPGIGTGITYDNPQSQITIPANATLANWPAFRVDVIFQVSGKIDRRLNLVEGDTSFAFFVEKDASLMGTIFDGTEFYPVKSAPGTIVPGTLYRAQFLYMPSSTLVLTLNGGTLTVQGSNGAPVRPVQANGIKVGYWPGGDSRYTFSGLMGPMSISTLDPYSDAVSGLGKLVCNDLWPKQDLFNLVDAASTNLAPAEANSVESFFRTLVDGAWKAAGALIGTANDPRQAAVNLNNLSSQFESIAIRNQQQGTNFLSDPQFYQVIQGLNNLLDSAPAAKEVLFAQVIRDISQLPLSPSRIQEIFADYPDALVCFGEIAQTIANPGNPVGGWTGSNFPFCWPKGWPVPYCGTGPGGTGPGGTGPGGTGPGGTGPGGTGPGGTGPGGTGPGGTGCSNTIHIHVNCCSDDKKQ